MIRAFQWDLARQVERLPWLLEKLPLYAEWGYQQLYLHLEDAVEYPSQPEVARTDAYRLRDLERLAKRALALGITTVPIVNLLGHTQYLIQTKGLRELNELLDAQGKPLEKGQVCPLHPRLPAVAEGLLRDVSSLCTAGLVHVGLDESFHLGKHPLSREEVARLGLGGHFAAHACRLESLARAQGLRLGLWADMLALLPEAIPLLPSGLAAYDWYYYPFPRLPRLELRNFADYDLAPALRQRGIGYWGCGMNGAFRFEPLPLFRDRLANLRSWWERCQRVGAEGFLVSSWESYRLAQETTTVVDAAAASLWLDPGIENQVDMLTRGFQRVYGPAKAQARARAALACDAHAFAGYARWEINNSWDCCAPREGYKVQAREQRFFARLEAQGWPPAFETSFAFRHYLAQRDVFVRHTLETTLAARRALARGDSSGFALCLKRLERACATFPQALAKGLLAAKAMRLLSRPRKRRGQNELLLEQDARRHRKLVSWLKEISKTPAKVWKNTPVCGAWQLQFWVHNTRPALQRVVLERRESKGSWVEIKGRYTIEFQARAARPRAVIRREFACALEESWLEGNQSQFRISVRGLGQVEISHIEITNGVKRLAPEKLAGRHCLGQPAPKNGWPELDLNVDRGHLELRFQLDAPPERHRSKALV